MSSTPAQKSPFSSSRSTSPHMGRRTELPQRFAANSSLVSPDGADDSLTIADASIYRGVLDAEQALTVDLLRPRTYLHLVREGAWTA